VETRCDAMNLISRLMSLCVCEEWLLHSNVISDTCSRGDSQQISRSATDDSNI